MKNCKIIFIFFLLLILQGCPILPTNYSCKFTNNSNVNVVVSAVFPIKGLRPPTALYPDTSVAAGGDTKIWLVKAHSEKFIFEWDIKKREDVFAQIDTLCVFIIHEDTITKYPYLDELNNAYNILHRYDLSLENMRQLNWELSYPPDPRMSNMKMYPPYGSE